MAKLTLTDVASAYESIQAINANYALIEAAIENTLSRDGTTPNSMSADLDMNGNNILNAGVVTYSNIKLINTVTDAAYTGVSADANKIVERNNASANTFTVPPNSSVAYTIGTTIDVIQLGAGTTTIVAGSGVTIRSRDTLVMDGQYSTVTLYKRATDEWVLFGRLVL